MGSDYFWIIVFFFISGIAQWIDKKFYIFGIAKKYEWNMFIGNIVTC